MSFEVFSMNDLNFVNMLENDESLFDKKFNELTEFYHLRNHDKVLNYINKHKGLIILLNELKPNLIDNFPNAKFDLIFYTDPEVKELSHLILYVKVDDYTFDNGVMEDIDKIRLEFMPLRQKLGVMPNLSIMPALYDW